MLPGVVFMLRDVFPNYMFWRYVDEGDREVIALSCMQMIHQLLSLNFSKESPADSNRPVCILYRACLHSLLFLDAGAALLRIVGSGMYMCNETCSDSDSRFCSMRLGLCYHAVSYTLFKT